ncbi:MAG: peptide chain release factor N(5)-glutamine methyltransferase [Rhodobacteraceae bacterium]|nr:peptide chain release factor N(5)-glutamine methyltransferase [Paracoccaceae bacterium]
MRVAEAVENATLRLRSAGVEDAVGDSWRLLLHAVPGRMPVPGDRLEEGSAVTFENFVKQRERRQPVAQIIGKRLFHEHEFTVNSHVLDPRPDSEALVRAAIDQSPSTILDLGTGNGCLLISVLAACPNSVGLGIDISRPALRIARQNADRILTGDRARFVADDWNSTTSYKFDAILANPPYVSKAEYLQLPPEIRDWEPVSALTLMRDGFCAYPEIASVAARCLTGNGILYLEIGPGQRNRVMEICLHEKLEFRETVRDLDGRERILLFSLA